MADLRYTLVADGGSDRALLPILSWLLRRVFPHHAFTPQFADPRLRRSPERDLTSTLRFALDYYPCDLLFIHRDAENAPPDERYREIQQALEALTHKPPAVCVVPVRMTEAWLMFDKTAIRRAAGNPNGRTSLDLVPLNRVESMPDPKNHLREQLMKASELTGRRLSDFKQELSRAIQRVAELIEDFSPLYHLSAFQRLEHDLRTVDI